MRLSVGTLLPLILNAGRAVLATTLLTGVARAGDVAEAAWTDRLGDTIPRGIAVGYDGTTTLAAARDPGSLAEPVYELYQFAPGGDLRWRVDLTVGSDFDLTAASRFAVDRNVRTDDEFLTFWRLVMRDGDPLHRNLVPLPQTAVGGILLGDNLLGLWRIGADGKTYWHRSLALSFGLSLATELAHAADDSILVGGLSTAIDGGCATAAVMRIDDFGFVRWRWHFDDRRGTYPIRLLPWPDGMTLALVTTELGNRHVGRWGDTPCGTPERDGTWLVWINSDGTTARIVEMPRERFVLGIAAFADGRAVVGAWGPRDLLIQVYGPAGGEVLAERAYDRWRVFGWSEHAYAIGRFDMQASADRILLVGTIGCNPKAYWTWPCPGQGRQLLELTPDLRVRTMPIAIDWDWQVAHGPWNTFKLVRPVLRGGIETLRE